MEEDFATASETADSSEDAVRSEYGTHASHWVTTIDKGLSDAPPNPSTPTAAFSASISQAGKHLQSNPVTNAEENYIVSKLQPCRVA